MSSEAGFSGFSKECYLSRFRNAFQGYADFCDFIFGAIENGDSTRAHELIAKSIRDLANSVDLSKNRAPPRWYQHPIGWAFDFIYLDINGVLAAIQTTLNKARENVCSESAETELIELDKCCSRLSEFVAEYDSSLKELNRMQNLLTRQTLNYYAEEISKEPDSSVIASVSELFDLWVTSAETLNVRAIACSSHANTYAAFVSAGCRVKTELDSLQRITMNSIAEGVLQEIREKVELIKGSTFER